MARTLRIDTAASPSLLLERARRAASENGVSLVGNASSGRFSHRMLEGNYCRLGRTVIVTITHKHRLVPWSVLEGRLRGLFGGASPGIPPVREKSTAAAPRVVEEPVTAASVKPLIPSPQLTRKALRYTPSTKHPDPSFVNLVEGAFCELWLYVVLRRSEVSKAC